MRTYNWCVCIDEQDNALVMRFTNGSHPSVHADGGLLPPEYRTETFAKGDGQVESEFDIFQLGMLLWHLYRGQHQQGARTFCSLAGCDKGQLGTCKDHNDPINLPKAGVNVPDYLDRVIALCRQEDPRQRPAAWELINMFPDDGEIMRQIDSLDTHKQIIAGARTSTSERDSTTSRLEDIRGSHVNYSICEYCREECIGTYYKREACKLRNCDQCQACFIKGEHCYDRAHLLGRMSTKAYEDEGLLKEAYYYSSVDEKGNREEIIVR
jgi:hypothetical protein